MMNERMRESLSALLDDEANEMELERVLATIGGDEELRQAWRRYNTARDTLNGHPPEYPGLDISARVRSALDQQSGGQASFRQRVLRPVASLAVAASVAATVVIGGQQLATLGDADYAGNQNTYATNASPVGMLNSLGATPVRASLGIQSVPVLQPATRTAYQELARQRMGRYMQEHAEHAALNSPQGLIPFARVPKIRE